MGKNNYAYKATQVQGYRNFSNSSLALRNRRNRVSLELSKYFWSKDERD